MSSISPVQSVDCGLSGLSLIAGYYRIAADPAQLSHQLALTGRMAKAEDLVRAANILQAEVAHRSSGDRQASRRCSLSRPDRPQGRRLRRLGRGRDEGARAPDRSGRPRRAGADDRGDRGSVLRRTHPGHAPARRSGHRSQYVRLPLVPPRRFCATGARSPTCWSHRCSCKFSRLRRRSSSSSSSTRCWFTRACRPWSCSCSAW